MIKLYFANLAAYNNGTLDGKWFDLSDYTDINGLMDDVKRDVLRQRNNEAGEPEFEYGISDEEWAIHDYEAPFQVSEYEGIENIAAMISYCSLDEYDQKRAAWLFDNGHYASLSDCIDRADDVTFYEGMTLEDVAADMVDEGLFGNIPDQLKYYIDYAAIARDLSCDGYREESDGVFYYQ